MTPVVTHASIDTWFIVAQALVVTAAALGAALCLSLLALVIIDAWSEYALDRDMRRKYPGFYDD